MTAPKPIALFLMGPTAAGKTELAIRLVEAGLCDIISVDSAQVFTGMNIGTAKPDSETLARAPHHLIDICDPADSYSAVQFKNDALPLMKAITKRGKVPLLVGGTMLYFKTLVEPMADLPPGDADVRTRLHEIWQNDGLRALVAELEKVDPIAHAKIDLQNPQRVQRALEVFHVTGRPISEFWAEGVHDGKGRLSDAAISEFPWQLVQYAVMPKDRSFLHERIALRFQQMLDLGFEQEVIELMARGNLHLDLPSMRCVGYRQMWKYLAGDIGFEQMKSEGIAATRQLAKRQLTWLRGWPQLSILASESDVNGQLDSILCDIGSRNKTK